MRGGMTAIQQIAYDTIQEIQQAKRDAGKFPDRASMTEISNSIMVELKEAINTLALSGVLEWHKTVNGVPMFGIKGNTT